MSFRSIQIAIVGSIKLETSSHHKYDSHGNHTLVIATYDKSVAATAHYVYDGDGELIGQGNPNGTSRGMTYDARGNQLTETWYASGGSITNQSSYSYDGDGEMLTAGNNAGSYTFTYNADGQQTKVIDPHGVTLNYQYDADNHVTEVTNSLGNADLAIRRQRQSDPAWLQRSLQRQLLRDHELRRRQRTDRNQSLLGPGGHGMLPKKWSRCYESL